MTFDELTTVNAAAIAPWFDDPATQRYLGNREWLYREIELMQRMPGQVWQGVTVWGRYAWLAHDARGACGLVTVEIYDDRSAALALVVAPARRRQGIGAQILAALETRSELARVSRLFGSVEPDNRGALLCCERAGFTVAQALDEDGMLPVAKQLHGC